MKHLPTGHEGIMNVHFLQRVVALVVLTTFLTTGCASLQPVAPAAVQVGESVVLKTHSGETRKFKVTGVENDALVGENVRVPYADIASLDVRREGEHKMKPGVIIGIVAAAAALAVVLGSGGGGGSGY
jgi:hypothetical protein